MDINKIIETEFQEFKNQTAANMRRAGHTDKWAQKISLNIKGSNTEIKIPEAVIYAETGRGPAKGGKSNQMFLQNLKDWIKAKNITVKDDAELNRLAEFFKWHINKFGTKQWQAGKLHDIYTTPLKEFQHRVASRVSQQALQQLTQVL